MKKHFMLIEFPNEEDAKIFAAWMLDGGGDQGFYEAYTNEKPDAYPMMSLGDDATDLRVEIGVRETVEESGK